MQRKGILSKTNKTRGRVSPHLMRAIVVHNDKDNTLCKHVKIHIIYIYIYTILLYTFYIICPPIPTDARGARQGSQVCFCAATT